MVDMDLATAVTRATEAFEKFATVAVGGRALPYASQYANAAMSNDPMLARIGFAGIPDSASKQLDTAWRGFTTNQPAAGGSPGGSGNVAGTTLDKENQMLDKLGKDDTQKGADFLGKAVSAMGSGYAAIVGVATSIIDMAGIDFSGITNVLGIFGSGITTLINVMGGAAIEAALPTISSFFEYLASPAVIAAAQAIGAGLGGIINALWPIIEAALPDLYNLIENDLIPLFQDLIPIIGQLVADLTEIMPIINAVCGALGDYYSFLGQEVGIDYIPRMSTNSNDPGMQLGVTLHNAGADISNWFWGLFGMAQPPASTGPIQTPTNPIGGGGGNGGNTTVNAVVLNPADARRLATQVVTQQYMSGGSYRP